MDYDYFFQKISPYRNRSSLKGFNFLITSKTLPYENIVATIEDAVKDLENEGADTIRAKVSLTLEIFKLLKDNLCKDECKALKEWQSDS